MTDDIVTRLREIANDEVYRAEISVGMLYEAANEIERLREENTKLRGTVLDIDKTGQQLWSMVSASRDSYADEVMYLREENDKASALIAKLAELLLPYSMLMNKHEQEMLIKAVRGEPWGFDELELKP